MSSEASLSTLAHACRVKSGFGDSTAEENGGVHKEPCPLQHDDDIGEEVSFDEAQMVCDAIVRKVSPQSATLVKYRNWVHVRTCAWTGPIVIGTISASELPRCAAKQCFQLTSGMLRAHVVRWSWAAAADVLKEVMLRSHLPLMIGMLSALLSGGRLGIYAINHDAFVRGLGCLALTCGCPRHV